MITVSCRPRASGGHPRPICRRRRRTPSSPRERGSSHSAPAAGDEQRVVPARAGVIRARTATATGMGRRPRASGGHPLFDPLTMTWGGSSPRERGSSLRRGRPEREAVVVPARAGVILHRPTPDDPGRRRPRASGGHPPLGKLPGSVWTSSPRERGSSGPQGRVARRAVVVPARAGVILAERGAGREAPGRPRASGGHPPASSS